MGCSLLIVELHPIAGRAGFTPTETQLTVRHCDLDQYRQLKLSDCDSDQIEFHRFDTGIRH